MQYICDFHIHSKYSRATSKDTDLNNLAKWAQIKGVDVLGTGDFTHPLWLKELKEKLVPAEQGLFKYKGKNNNGNVRFILTVEISSIYSKGGKVRKIHNIIFAPSFEVVEKINAHLGWIGNLKSDGRPILGLDAKELAKIVLNISEDCLIVPGHIYTPWFSLFGSNSGFDSIEECFEEYSKYIYALETGLSSDPAMSWTNSALDDKTLISNSDSHSPPKIGREANVFEGEKIDYDLIAKAIKNGASSYAPPSVAELLRRAGKASEDESFGRLRLTKTLEFFPEEGKYHWDGHRNCNVCLSPEESFKYNNICPRCGRPLTIGVMNRVCQLADRKPGEKPANAIPFVRLIPLDEIIADVLGVGTGTKAVNEHYKNLVRIFGSELKVLLEAKKEEISAVSLLEIGEGVERVRQGKVIIRPGYDGEFGKISIFGDDEEKPRTIEGQKTLWN